MKNLLKSNSVARTIFFFYLSLAEEYKFNIFKYFESLVWYLKDLSKFNRTKNSKAKISMFFLIPYLSDRTKLTHVEPIYFFQDTWAAKKIFEKTPKRHYDVGSNIKTLGIISQFIPVTFVDIRPPDVELTGLDFVRGTILRLPFKSNSIASLSSLCVIEHIGLGRYGDTIDPYGSEKAVSELQRVLKKNGDLYISVPVDFKDGIYFNAHRVFTPSYLLSLFDLCELVEEKYLYAKKLFDKYDPKKGFGTGFFHLKRK